MLASTGNGGGGGGGEDMLVTTNVVVVPGRYTSFYHCVCTLSTELSIFWKPGQYK